jgi:hypothetical protein
MGSMRSGRCTQIQLRSCYLRAGLRQPEQTIRRSPINRDDMEYDDKDVETLFKRIKVVSSEERRFGDTRQHFLHKKNCQSKGECLHSRRLVDPGLRVIRSSR